MNITRKDATIVNSDEEFPGSFEVVLSTPAKDRDGDELAIEDWKQPLPDHITFDTDHGMSVETIVGSGIPTIEDGKMIVRGTYSSLARAQDVRTLVKEKHIRTTSVAFMSEKVTKDGKTKSVRELLNGAFVAIPSNRESLILSGKSGARNSQSDAAAIQAIHDHAIALGATPAGPSDDTGAEVGATGGKSYTAEQERQMLAQGHAMKGPDGSPSYPIGNKTDLANAIHAVGRGGADHDSIRAYIMRRAKDLGASDMIPSTWQADGSMMKAAPTAQTKTPGDSDDDAGRLAQAVDAALDEAQNLLSTVDPTTLPEPVQQALGLISAAEEAVDKLLDVLGVPDPDEGAATGDAAPAGDAAKSVDAEAIELKGRAIQLAALAG